MTAAEPTVRCPKCQNQEPAGSTTCRMCFAPLDPGPPDRDTVMRRAAATTALRRRVDSGAARYAPAATWPTADARPPQRRPTPTRPTNTSAPPVLRRRNDPVAVAALVCGILALGPLAMLLGVWGRRRVHSRPARGGYALASIGLWLGLAATLVYLWLALDTGGASSV